MKSYDSLSTFPGVAAALERSQLIAQFDLGDFLQRPEIHG